MSRESRFIDDGVGLEYSQCMYCKHHLGEGVCPAFPDGIPYAIRANDFDHTKAYPGDNGIRFEKRELTP